MDFDSITETFILAITASVFVFCLLIVLVECGMQEQNNKLSLSLFLMQIVNEEKM